MIGGKTSTTSYLAFIHLESFWRIQLKITDHRMNRKWEHSAKWNFPDWTQNYLPDWHAAAASITQVVPIGVSSRWKSQITAGIWSVLVAYSPLCSSFSRFRVGGCGKTIFCYTVGFSPVNLSEQPLRAVVGVESVSHWIDTTKIVLSHSYRSLVWTLAMSNCFATFQDQ
jgi:hypothetical protein